MERPNKQWFWHIAVTLMKTQGPTELKRKNRRLVFGGGRDGTHPLGYQEGRIPHHGLPPAAICSPAFARSWQLSRTPILPGDLDMQIMFRTVKHCRWMARCLLLFGYFCVFFGSASLQLLVGFGGNGWFPIGPKNQQLRSKCKHPSSRGGWLPIYPENLGFRSKPDWANDFRPEPAGTRVSTSWTSSSASRVWMAPSSA